MNTHDCANTRNITNHPRSSVYDSTAEVPRPNVVMMRRAAEAHPIKCRQRSVLVTMARDEPRERRRVNTSMPLAVTMTRSLTSIPVSSVA